VMTHCFTMPNYRALGALRAGSPMQQNGGS
jgi:hypothetical protein